MTTYFSAKLPPNSNSWTKSAFSLLCGCMWLPNSWGSSWDSAAPSPSSLPAEHLLQWWYMKHLKVCFCFEKQRQPWCNDSLTCQFESVYSWGYKTCERGEKQKSRTLMLQVRLQTWNISTSVFFLSIICSILIQSSQNTNNIKTDQVLQGSNYYWQCGACRL